MCLLRQISSWVGIAASMLFVIPTSYADTNGLIPAVKSSFYYQMGGGQDVPLPAFYDRSSIPLSVNDDVGLGFNCGAFNPVNSITNSLNNIKDSALNVEQQVLSNATSAVTEFPLYELSRSDPNLYNLITNAMAGAQNDLAISTKSCDVMQSQMAAGQDPYAHWGQIALGDKWKQDIGSAEVSGKGDINQAREDVAHSHGDAGIPWVNASAADAATTYAGGKDQPPIRVIHDTSMAGYRVIANAASSAAKSGDSGLKRAFPTAQDAATWIVNAVGDETITTYDSGQKSSQPGTGLYTDVQAQMKIIVPKLQALVASDAPASLKQLQAVSPDGMMLSPASIQSIRQQPVVIRQILVNKLAQNIAAMQVLNKAQLATRILQSGSRIPAIYSNAAAQHLLQQSMTQLHNDVARMLQYIKARQLLMSNLLLTLNQVGQLQTLKNTSIAMPAQSVASMSQGAVTQPQTAATSLHW